MNFKRPKKNKFNDPDIVIYAAALQDHYSRNLTKNAQKLLKLPPINPKNNKTKHICELNEKKMKFDNEDQMKIRKYINSLTLAQKLGLVPAPPQPLSFESWEMIEEQARKRKEGEGLCPICLENFKGFDQIILSCSHMFHKNCLQSFEKLCKIKMCPICRKQDYDKKETNQGFIFYQNKCIILIQKNVKGFLCRKQFFEFLIKSKIEIVAKLLKRKLLSYKLANIGKRIDKNMKKKHLVSEKIMKNLEQNIQEKTMNISNNLQELRFIEMNTKENREKVLEIIWNQYENNLKKSLEKNNQNTQNLDIHWSHILKKGLERCESECAICLNPLFNAKPLYLLSCSHIFHIHCIEALERYSLQEEKKCPICREAYKKINLVMEKNKKK